VVTAVERAGVTLQVGFIAASTRPIGKPRHSSTAAAIGRPTTFKAIGRDPSCPPLTMQSRLSGRTGRHMAIHDFDLARWLMSSESNA